METIAKTKLKILLLIALLCIFCESTNCLAFEGDTLSNIKYTSLTAKSKVKQDSLKISNIHGDKVIYGSILDKQENKLLIKLPQRLFSAIRKVNKEKIYITISQVAESPGQKTNIYFINSQDSISLSRRLLEVNLFSHLVDITGIRFKPDSLPEGEYKLSLTVSERTVDGEFEYKTPVIIAGTLKTNISDCSGSINSLTDLNGNTISNPVSLSGCSYLNELQGDKIKSRITNSKKDSINSVAISKIVTHEGIFYTPIILNAEKNGEAVYDVTPETTKTVTDAVSLLKSKDEKFSEENFNFLQEILLSEAEKDIININANENNTKNLLAQSKPCNEKLLTLLSSVSTNPSKDELLEFGKQVINQFENNELTSCFSNLVSEKIIPYIKSKGNESIISFAENFILTLQEELNETIQEKNEKICQGLNEQFSVSPFPCLSEELKQLCKNDLIEIINNECQDGLTACNLLEEEVNCTDVSKIESIINLCTFCNNDEDCSSQLSTESSNGCKTAQVSCISTLDPKSKEVKVCYINDDVLVDPFTCKELPKLSAASQCLAPSAPQCKINSSGNPKEGFDKRCCPKVHLDRTENLELFSYLLLKTHSNLKMQSSEPKCGNGVKEGNEQCDDGNTDKGDGCSDKCEIEICGNGIKDRNEECDDGNTINTDECSNLCKEARCGDGIIQPSKNSEECDDGNTNKGDGCSDNCKFEQTCGNGVKEGNEQCDDGNTNKGDGCSDKCNLEICGNGIRDDNEECDDGNIINTDQCTSVCKKAKCGDGILQPSNDEECDDGNNNKGDGCEDDCEIEPISPTPKPSATPEASPTPKSSATPEASPTPKPSSTPEASPTQTPEIPSKPVCGNNKVEANEQCDDGNTKDNDGCSSNCKIEPPRTITSQPGSPNIPIEACVFKILCSNIEANFTPGDFGKPKENIIEVAIQQCKNLLLGSDRPNSLPPPQPTNTTTFTGGTEPTHPPPEGGIDPQFCIFNPRNPICTNRTYFKINNH